MASVSAQTPREIQGRSLWQDARRRLFANKAAVTSMVILAIIAASGRVPMPNQGTLSVVGAATAAFCEQLAVDLGPQGVRVVCLCSAGSPRCMRSPVRCRPTRTRCTSS